MSRAYAIDRLGQLIVITFDSGATTTDMKKSIDDVLKMPDNKARLYDLSQMDANH